MSRVLGTAARVIGDEKQAMQRYRRGRRSVTLSIRAGLRPEEKVAAETLLIGALDEAERPRKRADCLEGGANESRPCPWVSCKYHLFLDVEPETGSLKLNFPNLEVDELADTCALDVAEAGGVPLEEIGRLINVTRERARQVEVRSLLRLKLYGVGHLDVALDDRD